MLPSYLHEPEYSHGASELFAPGEQVDDQHPIDFAIGEAGLRVKLQGSNPEPPCPLCAKSRLMHRSKKGPYSINWSVSCIGQTRRELFVAGRLFSKGPKPAKAERHHVYFDRGWQCKKSNSD